MAPEQRSSLNADTAQGARTLLAIAQSLAVRASESNPSDARMVKSTRQRAVDALTGGDKVNSDQPVYVVQLKGTFSPASRPPQHKPGASPTGNTLTVLVDPATGQVTDWGISNAEPGALEALGPVRNLP